MQVETTTITTEQMPVAGAIFDIVIFEQNITAFCDTCPNTQTASRNVLENSGWFLGHNEQFCPTCNF